MTQTVERPTEDLSTDDKGACNTGTPSVLARLMTAFDARDLEAMEQLRTEFGKSGKDASEQASNDEFYLELRSKAGDPRSMEELKRMGTSGPRAPQARLCLANALTVLGQPGVVQDAYRNAIAIAETDGQKAQAKIGLACEIEKSGQWEEAERMLVDALSSISEATARVELLDSLASIAKEHEQCFLAVLALEESLALNPGDTGNLFELGYCADEIGLPGISVAVYKQLLAISPKDDASLNNLGVALKKLGLPALAVRSYQQAAELGATLADANLADMLINAGFLSIARKRLMTASNAEDPHENVYGALARIEKKQKEEDKSLEKVLVQTRESVDQLTSISRSLFSGRATGQIEGAWSEPGGSPFQLKVTEGHIMGQCNADKHQWTLTGSVDFAGGGHVEAAQIDGYARLSGYISLEPDGSALQLVLSNSSGKGDLTSWRFTRVPPPTT